MKAFWTGSDALFLAMYPPSKKRKYIYMFCLRIYARLTDFFCKGHLINHEGLRAALQKFGMKKPIEVFEDPYDKTIYPKIEHKSFNILFYLPKTNNQPYADWIYGKEYLEYLQTYEEQLPEHYCIIKVDGSKDMAKIYPFIDVYIKINRTKYNAINRMGKECLLNDIPVLIVQHHLDYFPLSIKKISKFIDKKVRELKWTNIKKDITSIKQEKRKH